jgi:acyl-CoA thioester hydrolase
MARIKIDIQGKLLFSTQIQIRITDINYGNHAGNDSLVGILQETRMKWLHSFGFTELNINGTGLIQSDLAVEFKAEAFYGDVLTVDLYVADITRAGFDLLYTITTTRGGKKITVLNAKTGMICFDYENKKVVVIPDALLKIIG